ncbi:MAG: hypothetical protein JXR81_11615 [Candidatus Goldbacteria bacterium]|nr:hypothetical protein [Candidatus Goldiibacteriota bacterium]
MFYTFPTAWLPIDRGLDNSHFYAFNHLFASDMQAGRDIIFTKGPLGFLLGPQPIAKNMETAFVLNLAVYSFFIIGALIFIRVYHKKGGIVPQALLIIITVFFLNIFNRMGRIEFLYSMIVYLYLYIYEVSERKKYLVAASLFAAFAALIKQSSGVFGLLAVLSYFALSAGKKGALRGFALSIAVSFFGFLAMWLMIYGNLQGVITYIQSAVYFSAGHTIGMALESKYSRAVIAAGILLWILGLALIKDKPAAKSLLILLMPFLSVLKYVFGREDAYHYLAFIIFLIIMLYFSMLHIRKLKPLLIYTCLGIISIAVIFTNIAGTEFGIYAKNDVFKKFFIADGYRKILDFSKYKKAMIYHSEIKLKQSKIPSEIRDKIGNKTADVYPVEISYIPANYLNWKPRPVFQSYIAYLPWLENKNLQFFSKDSIPEYLIFENISGKCATLDDGYVFNDEPRVIMKILEKYHPESQYNQRIIFRRNETSAKWQNEETTEDEVSFGEWIQVPKQRGIVTSARVKVKKTFYGNLKSFFYREPKLLISYMTESGEIYRHNLPAGNIENGIWISPYITDPGISLIKAQSSGAPYGLKRNSRIKTDITIREDGCEIVLYGRISEPAIAPEIYAVFENSFDRYEFKTEQSGIGPEKGALYLRFDRHLLPKGDYSAGLRIKSASRNNTALIMDKKIHVDKHKDYIHGAYVTAVKLELRDKYFYAGKFKLKWVNYNR